MNRFCSPRFLRPLLVAGALAIAALGIAQGSALNETAFGLSTPEMQADLSLTGDQKSEVDRIFRAYSHDQQALISRSKGEAAQSALDQLDANYAQKLLKVLSAAQRSRLEQISLQSEGTAAMARAEVAQELGLSAEQRSKINALASAARQKQEDFDAALGAKLEALPQPKSKTSASLKAYEAKKNAIYAGMQGEQKKIEAFKEQTNEKILATLTPAQKSKWRQMVGKKFNP